MRVLSLVTLYPAPGKPGNFGQFVARQFEALAKRGDVALTVIAPLSARQGRTAETEADLGYPVHRPRYHRMPLIGGRCDPVLIARAVLPLARRLHAEQPFDLIDAQFFYPDGPAAARIAAALGLPLSIKARGSDIHQFGRRSYARARMLAAAEWAQGLLAVSEALRQDMIAMGMAADKIGVHRTGLDRSLFRIRPRDKVRGLVSDLMPESGPVLVSAGNLVPLKRHDRAIELLAHLPDASLVIAGEGPEAQRLHALATDLGVAGRVRFCGVLSHQRLATLLSAANLLIHPSEREGLANVWIEALACGTPVLVNDVGSAREVVRGANAGIVTAWTDTPAVAMAARALLANPPSQAHVAASVKDFSWERNATELAAHYAQICQASESNAKENRPALDRTNR